MRPASRSGFGGGAGAGGEWGGRPGTGAQRLGTGMRPGSGRLGTGVVDPVYSGVGLATDVQVADRPVTQQGMMGMRPASAGPGRQIQDGSYFLGLLRSKVTLLSTEINKLKGDVEQSHKDSNTYANLERQYEALIKTVRGLEGELADYNLAMDKSRTSTDPADITHYFSTLKARNEFEASEIDKIFIARQEKERVVEDLEGQMREIQHQAAARMEHLPADAREEFGHLTEENDRLAADIAQMQAQLENVNLRVGDAEEELSRDRWREEGQRLERQLERLHAQYRELQEESKDARMDPAERRERLFAKVKADNEKLLAVTNRLKAIKEENEKRRSTIAELETDLSERKGEGGESSKYEVLFQRDQEITEFIEKFPDSKAKATDEKKRAQATIAGLLEHISAELERQDNLPSAQQVKGMREDAEVKGMELENAQTTHERLQQELQKRQQELAKIQTLDEKISLELKSLSEKMTSMRQEMVMFANIEELKHASERVARDLEGRREDYASRRDMARQQANLLSARYERAKAQLAGDETAKSLESQEQKLRHYEQSIFAMREFVETKGRESEYVPIRDESIKMVDELNAMVVRAQATFVPSMGSAF